MAMTLTEPWLYARLCRTADFFFIPSSHPGDEVGAVIIPSLQIRKPRLPEGPQEHPAHKGRCHNSVSGWLGWVLEPLLLPPELSVCLLPL